MITRIVKCKNGILVFTLKSGGWQITLKQGGNLSFLQSCSLGYDEVQSLDGLIDLYVRLHGLGEIEKNFICIKFSEYSNEYFEVFKTGEDNVICISRVYKRSVYRNFYIQGNFYDISSLWNWCLCCSLYLRSAWG